MPGLVSEVRAMVEQRHAASHQRQAKARLGWFDPCVAQRSWLRRGYGPAGCVLHSSGQQPSRECPPAARRPVPLAVAGQGAQRAKQQRAGLLGLQRWRAIALAELVSVRLDDQRQVQVAWLWQAEDLLQIKLAGRRIEQVGAAHHIGDALPGVIQHHGQLIGNQAVAAANDEIADLAAQMLAELALHTIDEDVFTIGYAQADGSILEAATGGAAEAGVGAG